MTFHIHEYRIQGIVQGETPHNNQSEILIATVIGGTMWALGSRVQSN